MAETYGVSVQVHVRQIVAPIGAGEARIPALVRLPDERLFLFYDERPAPASGTGADFNGLTMASDLPNPNQIRWMECDACGEWSDPHPLPEGAPPVSSDACVGVDGAGGLRLQRHQRLWARGRGGLRAGAWPMDGVVFPRAMVGDVPGARCRRRARRDCCQRPSMIAMRGS